MVTEIADPERGNLSGVMLDTFTATTTVNSMGMLDTVTKLLDKNTEEEPTFDAGETQATRSLSTFRGSTNTLLSKTH